jgi:hypothetical protein
MRKKRREAKYFRRSKAQIESENNDAIQLKDAKATILIADEFLETATMTNLSEHPLESLQVNELLV